tara:strand:- start:1446 stop:1643 length:198 start_codon:yes stop_codon:yes gene_type:complete
MPVWDRLRFLKENYEEIPNDKAPFLMVKIIIALIISYAIARFSISVIKALWVFLEYFVPGLLSNN